MARSRSRPFRPALRWLTAGSLLALLALPVWWPRRQAPPLLPHPARTAVVFLGDSITSGHGLPPEVTFPHRLGIALGIPIHNAGRSGDTTARGLARLHADVLVHRPRLVVVELGVNDAFLGVPVRETLANLRAIVRQARAAGAGVLLLHVGVPLPGAAAYREGLRAIAREEGAALQEDVLEGIVPALTSDGLHPTARGHARLATRLEPVLRELLGRPGAT